MLTMIIAMPPTCTYILKVFRLNSAAAKLARKACLDVEAATGTKLHVHKCRSCMDQTQKWASTFNSRNFSRLIFLNCLVEAGPQNLILNGL